MCLNDFFIDVNRSIIGKKTTYNDSNDELVKKISSLWTERWIDICNENELETLRSRYKQRVVNSYLKGRITDLERVFSSTTWRQAMYRTHYLKIISEIEKKMTKQIEKL